jgi:hypothetical protein
MDSERHMKYSPVRKRYYRAFCRRRLAFSTLMLVHEDVNARTVIDVVQRRIGIIWVINNKCSPEAIAILGSYRGYKRMQTHTKGRTQMGMIPKCAGLLIHGKVVQKRILGSYRALRNER